MLSNAVVGRSGSWSKQCPPYKAQYQLCHEQHLCCDQKGGSNQRMEGKTTEVAILPKYKYYMKAACSTLIATDDETPLLWNVERLGLWISLQAGTDNQLNRRSANAKFKKLLLSWVRTYYQKRWPRIRFTQTVKYVSSNPIQLSTSCKIKLCLKGILFKHRSLHFTWVRWGRLSSLAWTVFASEITRSPQKSIAPWHEWSLKKKSSSNKKILFEEKKPSSSNKKMLLNKMASLVFLVLGSLAQRVKIPDLPSCEGLIPFSNGYVILSKSIICSSFCTCCRSMVFKK